MHPVAALVVVAGKLGGRDELYPILHRVVIGILYAAQGVVVGDGHSVQPHPGRHQRQPSNGDRAVRISRMIVKIAGHGFYLL